MAPALFGSPQQVVEFVLSRVGRRVVLGLPLGVGKPNALVNAMYDRARDDRSVELVIATALTLEPPTWSSELERRLVDPIAQRLFEGYPPLRFAQDAARNALPPNVRVHEFYFAPGRRLHQAAAQRDYISTNYSQVARDLADRGVNTIGQLLAPSELEPGAYSLSTNPDVTLDLIEQLQRRGTPACVVGQVNRHAPFMHGAARVGEELFDALLDNSAHDFTLVGPPHEPISATDYAIAAHATALIADGGTLQLGIGKVADAITWLLMLRQRDPACFRSLLRDLGALPRYAELIARLGGSEPFSRGLYAATEMFVPGYLELYRAGILTREVDGAVLHAAFMLGPRRFYTDLQAMDLAQRRQFRMMPVSFTNTLQGAYEEKRAARVHARFLNSTMMLSLLGEAASDTLDDGRVVSGVGGQHDFLAMAQALPDARAILMLSAVREGREPRSNVRASLAHVAIPRHLRDLAVTEYGIADLRAKTDAEVIDTVLAISDARFQSELLAAAQRSGKIAPGYRPPERARDNTPARVASALEPYRARGVLPELPFGSDLSAEEVTLARVLRAFAQLPKPRAAASIARALPHAVKPPVSARPYLERLRLDAPASAQDYQLRAVTLAALHSAKLLA
jgi:acyl-CoA hydrolase